MEDGKGVGTAEKREQFRDGFLLPGFLVVVEFGAILPSAFDDRLGVRKVVPYTDYGFGSNSVLAGTTASALDSFRSNRYTPQRILYIII